MHQGNEHEPGGGNETTSDRSPGLLRLGMPDDEPAAGGAGQPSGAQPATGSSQGDGQHGQTLRDPERRLPVPGRRSGQVTKPLTQAQQDLISQTVPFVWSQIEQARSRGFPVSDESISDAFWQVTQAAIRHSHDEESFKFYCRSWVHGALCRAAKRAKKYADRSIDFGRLADGKIAKTETVREIEEKQDDLAAVVFASEESEDYARRLRVVKLALARIEGGMMRKVADLMAEGNGIRKISAALGITFHASRTYYDQVMDYLRKTIGIHASSSSEVPVPPSQGQSTQGLLFPD